MDFVDLYGRWKLSNSFANSVAERCRDIYIDVSNRCIKTFSGKQVITADCQITRKHNDFVILISAVHVNDEADCEGIAPDEAKGRYRMLQIWRPDGDLMKVLAPKLMLELEKVEIS